MGTYTSMHATIFAALLLSTSVFGAATPPQEIDEFMAIRGSQPPQPTSELTAAKSQELETFLASSAARRELTAVEVMEEDTYGYYSTTASVSADTTAAADTATAAPGLDTGIIILIVVIVLVGLPLLLSIGYRLVKKAWPPVCTKMMLCPPADGGTELSVTQPSGAAQQA